MAKHRHFTPASEPEDNPAPGETTSPPDPIIDPVPSFDEPPVIVPGGIDSEEVRHTSERSRSAEEEHAARAFARATDESVPTKPRTYVFKDDEKNVRTISLGDAVALLMHRNRSTESNALHQLETLKHRDVIPVLPETANAPKGIICLYYDPLKTAQVVAKPN